MGGLIFKNNNLYKFILIIAIITGIFARCYGLANQGFWADEIFSIIFASPALNKVFLWTLSDVHPPLYFVFLHYWIGFFGDSELALRMPSTIAGILSILFMYRLSRKVFDKHIATSATILLALSSTAIYYSQEARSYSFLLLFATITTLLWLDLLKKINTEEIKSSALIKYGAVCLLTAYTHYFGCALIFFQLIYLIFSAFVYKKYREEMIFLFFVIAALFTPWFLLHLRFITSFTGGKAWIPKPDSRFFLNIIDFLFTGKIILFLLILPLLLNIKAFIQNIRDEFKKFNPESGIICLSYLLLIPSLIFFIISFHTPILVDRYLIIFLPACYLIISIALSGLSNSLWIKSNLYIFLVSMAGFLMFLFPNFYKFDFTSYYNIPTKQQWREASQYIITNWQDNSIILLDKPVIVGNYYFNKLNKGKRKLIIKEITTIHDIKNINYNKYNKIFVLSFISPKKLPKNFIELEDELKVQLKKNSVRYNSKKFRSIFVYEYFIKDESGSRYAVK